MFRGYLQPRSAHESLIHTRDQLRLLARLARARSESPEHVYVHPGALSGLFERTAAYVDDALATVVVDPKAA
ncbi:XAC0095 family protein [Lysobacter changpingensis]|uniref:XAC0095 family protein n=1 Tax=Lysobacter changpingensis TaxID=2792784 RepID=UPI001A8E3AEF|nr:hypothetical protein [Lysobacter changpingensis]